MRALLLLAACGSATTARLDIRLASGVSAPASLRISLFGAGRLRDPIAVSLAGKTLPGSVIVGHLDPPPANFRVQIDGLDAKGAIVAQGAEPAALTTGSETRVTITLTEGTLPDRDLDGVPDVIDDCPDRPDADQLCAPVDAGAMPACPSFALFCDSFESGDFSMWQYFSSGPDRFLMVDGLHPFHGLYSLHAGDVISAMPHGEKWVRKTITKLASGTLALRAYAYIDGTLGQTFDIMALIDANSGFGYEVMIGNRGGVANLPLVLNGKTNVERVATSPIAGAEWHCFELLVDLAGKVHLFADGAEVVSFAENTDLSGNGYDAADVGDLDSSGDSTGSVFLDDVALATQRIGCE
jgi:hypothetical protein